MDSGYKGELTRLIQRRGDRQLDGKGIRDRKENEKIDWVLVVKDL